MTEPPHARRTSTDSEGNGDTTVSAHSTPPKISQEIATSVRTDPGKEILVGDTFAAVPERSANSQNPGTLLPQSLPPRTAAPTSRYPQSDLTPRSKPVSYYIVAYDDSLEKSEEPWSGPKLHEMTIDSLFTQALTHTCGREILRIKFALSSWQQGFVVMKDVVKKGDVDRLDTVKGRFPAAVRKGRKNGITEFSILLEPELVAQEVAEEIDDMDEI